MSQLTDRIDAQLDAALRSTPYHAGGWVVVVSEDQLIELDRENDANAPVTRTSPKASGKGLAYRGVPVHVVGRAPSRHVRTLDEFLGNSQQFRDGL